LPQKITDFVVPILDFLPCATPKAWIKTALAHKDDLLIDHANCEKKAASTALSLLYRYVEHPGLLQCLSRLAREELRHFEQVLSIMQKRGIEYRTLRASRYVSSLRPLVRTYEPQRLVDWLVMAGVIEARSCERFAALVPHLEKNDPELAKFYGGLLASEARHFRLYLDYAEKFSSAAEVQKRVKVFLAKEQELIEGPDDTFSFHSGVLV
jgi:tRNA-(ms[2]io[6]A)-hydroxylase